MTILIELEERFWRAAGDRDAYAVGLADGAVHVFPGMGVVDRDAALNGVAGAEPWASFSIDDPVVVELGADAAALVYTATANRPGQPTYRAAVTSVYLCVDGEPRLALHQQTPLG